MSIFRLRYNKPGTAPGLGALRVEAPSAVVSVMDFASDSFIEERDVSLERCHDFFASQNVTWVHVQGSPDLETLRSLAEAYVLHPLAVEDIVQLGQRPKLETFDKQLFVVLNSPRVDGNQLNVAQVSLFLGKSYVVSFCSGSQDPFDPVRDRIRAEPPGRIRQRGAHFLFYALIDLVIDQGFPALEELSTAIEEAEKAILERPSPETLDQVYHLKRTLIVLRKQLWPQREVVNALIREEHPLIHSRTRPYLRDCYDHAIQVLDLIESYREMTSQLQDLYMTSISNAMNEIMKVLTIIATIFMPLSFITGIYGMNFDPEKSPLNMPELGFYYGYPLVLGLLAVVALSMLFFFHRKRWI
jgi:magnesium transporter